MELQGEQTVHGTKTATLNGLNFTYQYSYTEGKKPSMISIYVQNPDTGFRVDGTYMLYDGHLRLHFQNFAGDESLTFVEDVYEGVKQVLAEFESLQ